MLPPMHDSQGNFSPSLMQCLCYRMHTASLEGLYQMMEKHDKMSSRYFKQIVWLYGMCCTQDHRNQCRERKGNAEGGGGEGMWVFWFNSSSFTVYFSVHFQCFMNGVIQYCTLFTRKGNSFVMMYCTDYASSFGVLEISEDLCRLCDMDRLISTSPKFICAIPKDKVQRVHYNNTTTQLFALAQRAFHRKLAQAQVWCELNLGQWA